MLTLYLNAIRDAQLVGQVHMLSLSLSKWHFISHPFSYNPGFFTMIDCVISDYPPIWSTNQSKCWWWHPISQSWVEGGRICPWTGGKNALSILLRHGCDLIGWWKYEFGESMHTSWHATFLGQPARRIHGKAVLVAYRVSLCWECVWNKIIRLNRLFQEAGEAKFAEKDEVVASGERRQVCVLTCKQCQPQPSSLKRKAFIFAYFMSFYHITSRFHHLWPETQQSDDSKLWGTFLPFFLQAQHVEQRFRTPKLLNI